MKGLTFVLWLVLEFKKNRKWWWKKYSTIHFSSKTETVINESDIDNVFESICSATISNTQKLSGKSSGWIIDSVVNHVINVLKYRPLHSSSYIKMLTQFDHSKNALINVQKIYDNKYFKYLNT